MIFFSQASKNIANFYACWDLMEITTLSNLMGRFYLVNQHIVQTCFTALATQTSGLSFTAEDAKLSQEAFNQIVEDIFAKIDMLQKWNRQQKIDNFESQISKWPGLREKMTPIFPYKRIYNPFPKQNYF